MAKPYWTLALSSLAATVLLCLAAPTQASPSAQQTSNMVLTPVAYRPAVGLSPVRRVSAGKRKARRTWVRVEPAKPSIGELQGLHGQADPLELKSSVALVIDQDTQEVLLSKNPHAVLPIASITKLMTALVVAEARLPMDEALEITQDDVDTEKHSRSRLRVGTQLSRGEMMHLALMASENRAAHALGRQYPGGMPAFVRAMNRKASALTMNETRFVEPTGLSSDNQSSARDLAILVSAAHAEPVIRELSVSTDAAVPVGQRLVQFRNTNLLVRNPQWEIGLQKTGYISEAGRCLVMQAKLEGRRLIMVLLDSAGKYSRIGDAERIRHWLSLGGAAPATRAMPQLIKASLAAPTAIERAPAVLTAPAPMIPGMTTSIE
jgi:serine-type D-Ala-D-Ala endopeptidase (penicillin-binding protein 7)